MHVAHCTNNPAVPLAQVLLMRMYETKPFELSQVLWGYARLRVPGAPGKVFLEAATDALHASMVRCINTRTYSV